MESYQKAAACWSSLGGKKTSRRYNVEQALISVGSGD
jgi:hypothetical protein